MNSALNILGYNSAIKYQQNIILYQIISLNLLILMVL